MAALLVEKEISRPEVLRQIPLFAELPRFELARLLPELRWLSFPGGSRIGGEADPPAVYFICSGQVEMRVDMDGQLISVMTLGPTSMFGALGFVTGQAHLDLVVTRTESTVICVAAAKLEEVFRRQPQFASHFMQLVVGRLEFVQWELARTRRILEAFTTELWESASADTAVALHGVGVIPAVEAAPVPVEPPGLRWSDLKRWLVEHRSWFLAMAIGLSVWLALHLARGVEPTTRTSLSILSWAGAMWVFTSFPEYAVAMTACIGYVLLGLADPKTALGGFADPTWFMILGVFGIGAAISKSGLLYRTALHILNSLPPTYAGQTMAMALTGLLVTPCLPSANARVALAGPLALEVSDGLGFGRHSKGAAGIGMSCLLGFGHMYYLFLNGTSSCLLVWGLLPPEVRQQITWAFWLLAALPLGVIGFVFSYLAIVKMLPVPERKALVSRVTLRAQLDLLGPWSRNEIATLTVVLMVLAAFVSEPLHHMHPAWPAMLGFLVLAFAGIVDKETVKRGIDWNFLLLFGALISVATITRATGVNDALESVLMPVLAPFAGRPMLFVPILGLLTVVLRLAIPWQPAVLIVLVTLMPLAQSAGYNPFLIGLVALAMSSPYFLPQQNSIYMTVHAGMQEAFDHRQVRKVSLVHTAIMLAGVVLSVPWWRFLGLLP